MERHSVFLYDGQYARLQDIAKVQDVTAAELIRTGCDIAMGIDLQLIGALRTAYPDQPLHEIVRRIMSDWIRAREASQLETMMTTMLNAQERQTETLDQILEILTSQKQ